MNRAEQFAHVRARLLRWYARKARDLPWRRRSDPYAVWVSEVMLQQTRAETVGAYFERFMERFPDVQALAAAQVGEVLKVWEGLGYYSRARNLHRAARIVVRDLRGRAPETLEGLRALPGIGRYTAGAVASIAFGLNEPVVDGNVERVLARVFALRTPLKEARTQKRLWSLARRLIPDGRASEFNQALMDLGATVCTPRKPRCDVCPLAGACRARAKGDPETLPRRTPKRPVPEVEAVVGVVLRGGRLLLGRRPVEGLLGGLWELPGGKIEPGETHAEALRRELREEIGIEVRTGEHLCTVRHAYSHFRVVLHAYFARHLRGRARAIGCDEVRRVPLDHVGELPLPRATHRILVHLRRRLAADGGKG